MQALLIKNEFWEYANGQRPKPECIPGDAQSMESARKWALEDGKAKADIILAIKPSELKQVKECNTSHELWRKLQAVYQPSGPARKATLIKQLTYHRMEEGGDAREHLLKFFDTVDKLSEMDVDINNDLLSVMLLHSLPASFENFRCAIESRDAIPTPDALRIKILEEGESRKHQERSNGTDAMFARKKNDRSKGKTRKIESEPKKDSKAPQKKEPFKFRCHRCRKFGHKAADCTESPKDKANAADDVSLCAIANSPVESKGIEAFQTANAESNVIWCVDSGCTAHMCGSESDFEEMNKSNDGKVNLANNASTEIKGKGSVHLTASMNGVTKQVKLRETLLVPELRTNLLSVGKICDRGFKVTFESDAATIVDTSGRPILRAERESGGLYLLKAGNRETVANSALDGGITKKLQAAKTWHRKMGHLNYQDLWNCQRSNAVSGLELSERPDNIFCDVCTKGKMTRAPFPKKSERKTEMLELIHSDICGPIRTESSGGSRYFATFIDDASRWSEVRFLRNKSDVLQAFKDYKALVENQTGRRVKYLQSDNGREYCNERFDTFLKDNGIGRRLTVPYTPEQNGVAERKNRTLLDMARCLLLQSSLPKSLWAEAVNTANYIRNRCPTSHLDGRTPYEAWKGKIPDVSHFQEFGRNALTLKREPGRDKFESRSRKGVLVGYSETSKGYRIWLPEERRIEIARDVKFTDANPTLSSTEGSEDLLSQETTESENIDIELQPRNIKHPNPSEEPADDLEDEGTDEEEAPSLGNATPIRGRGRPRLVRTGLRGRPRRLFRNADPSSLSDEAANLTEIPIDEAIHGPDIADWNDAIASELRSILKNDTWKLVDRPESATVIGSRVVLRNKHREDGTLERRKARIVARGFAQRPGVDFDATFAPVARMESIRTLMAVAAEKGMTVQQLDVTTAYLNGILKEKILMELPRNIQGGLRILASDLSEGRDVQVKAKQTLEAMQGGDKVCLLNKAIYGLKQAGRCWNDRLCDVLSRFGAKKSTADPCVFLKGHGPDLLIIAAYVDDILVASRNESEICKLKRFLANELEIKSLGNVKYCLGIEFHQNETGISMNQSGYIQDILGRFGMSNANPVSTPLDANVKLVPSTEGGSGRESLPYRELVGALMYVATCTRPDISFAVSYLSQFGTCYDSTHWTAAKRVLRYLKGSLKLGLKYRRTGDPVKGYVDADWANCPVDRKSYTGHTFVLGGTPVSWESRKQRTVALSSTEAEYMALTEAAKQATYIQRFLEELEYNGGDTVTILCDSNGARMIAENPVFHGRTKHIDIRHHYVREALSRGNLTVEYVSTDNMPADFLTKGLAAPKFRKCLMLLGMVNE